MLRDCMTCNCSAPSLVETRHWVHPVCAFHLEHEYERCDFLHCRHEDSATVKGVTVFRLCDEIAVTDSGFCEGHSGVNVVPSITKTNHS